MPEGGVSANDSSFVIENSYIVKCESWGMGGGMHVGASSSGFSHQVIGTLFETNSASETGGGISYDGGTNTLSLLRVTHEGDSSNDGDGGAIKLVSGDLTAERCLFSGGANEGNGGGTYLSEGTSAEFVNCLFQACNALDGFAVWSEGDSAFTNCTIVRNSAGGESTSVSAFVVAGGSASIANSIVYFNCRDQCSTSSRVEDQSAQLRVDSGSLTVHHSDIQGGVWSGPGNISSNPVFKSNVEFHLDWCSPCIDAGSDAAFPSGFASVDFDDANRFVAMNTVSSSDDIIDMGVDEVTVCVADTDGDGGVTIDDLILFLEMFDNSDPSVDLDDGSGSGCRDAGVTIDDLLFYLAHFDYGC